MNQRLERGAVDLNHFVETVDGRVGGNAVTDTAAQRDALQHKDSVCVEAQGVGHHLRGVGWQRVLTEQRSGDEGFMQAGAFGDLCKRQVFAGLGQQDDVGQGMASVLVDVGLDHGGFSVGKNQG